MDQTKWTILANLVKEIAASNYINSNVLKITLELNLLASADIIKDEPFHLKRIIRLNTGNFLINIYNCFLFNIYTYYITINILI